MRYCSEEQRLRRLDQLQVLDTAPEQVFDDIVKRALASFPGTSIASVSLVDGKRQWFKAVTGIDVKQTPRHVAFCAHTIQGTGAFVIEDATADPRFASNILVTSSPSIRFYAGVPLLDNVGALCVIGPTPRKATATEIAGLFNLATYVNIHLMLNATFKNLRIEDRQYTRKLTGGESRVRLQHAATFKDLAKDKLPLGEPDLVTNE